MRRLALVVLVACTHPHPEPLGPMYAKPSAGMSPSGQLALAVQLNGEGIRAYRRGDLDAAIARLEQAACRDTDELGYVMNLCIARYAKGELDDANLACQLVVDRDAPAALVEQARRGLAEIRTEAKRRGVMLRPQIGGSPPEGMPPDPGAPPSPFCR